jgi:hypothetical protein
MSKWAIVFNHDDHEFSVYPIESELRVRETIKLYQQKVQVDLTTGEWADEDAVMKAARGLNESRHYHEVPNTLNRHIPEEYLGGGPSIA